MKRGRDWPPTSKERPGLVAYGAPRKLPRLDEGPYVDVWTCVVRLATEEHRRRWKKMVHFRKLHYELRSSVETTKIYASGFPVIIRRSRNCVMRRHRRHCCDRCDLTWVRGSTDLEDRECLSWVCRADNCPEKTTRISDGQKRPILRYTSVGRWKKIVRSGLRQGEDAAAPRRAVGHLCGYLIQWAPKGLDYKYVLEKVEQLHVRILMQWPANSHGVIENLSVKHMSDDDDSKEEEEQRNGRKRKRL